MKTFFFLGLLLAASPLLAQGQPTQQTVPLNGATEVTISAALSSVEISNGSSNQLEILHEVIINGEERPDLRQLKVDRSGKGITISEVKPTIEALKDEFPNGVNNQTIQVNGETVYSNNATTTLSVKVPAGVRVNVESLYGSVTVTDVAGLSNIDVTYGSVDVILSSAGQLSELDIKSTYGPVDVTLPANCNANLLLRTNYGSLFTDFELDIDTQRSEKGQFKEKVVGTIGRGGPEVSCEAPYGNVYLRRAN